MKFFLVCHPNYSFQRSESQSQFQSHRYSRLRTDTIPIGPPEEVLGGPQTTYDLGWALKPTGFRAGRVRFIMTASEHPPDERIPLALTCHTLNEHNQIQRSATDKRWHFLLKSDPPTKLLKVDDVLEMPVWCCSCEGKIVERARVCVDCKDFAHCDQCFEEEAPIPLRHRNHKFQTIPIDA